MHRWLLLVASTVAACNGAACNGASAAVDPPQAARDAMLDVRADGCGPRVGLGTSTLIDETLALTAAHVVAGASSVTVLDEDGDEHDAQVVWFDPDLDLAALRVPTGIAIPVDVSDADADADLGVIAVSRGSFDDRTITTMDVGIPQHVDVATTDIYLERDVVRPGFEVTAAIEPGDSGTLVVTAAGAIGLIWSRSNTTPGRSWAVDLPDDVGSVSFRDSLTTVVDTGPCIR